jgi:hypothetical protein
MTPEQQAAAEGQAQARMIAQTIDFARTSTGQAPIFSAHTGADAA